MKRARLFIAFFCSLLSVASGNAQITLAPPPPPPPLPPSGGYTTSGGYIGSLYPAPPGPGPSNSASLDRLNRTINGAPGQQQGAYSQGAYPQLPQSQLRTSKLCYTAAGVCASATEGGPLGTACFCNDTGEVLVGRFQ
jgi:hypothetical protein